MLPVEITDILSEFELRKKVNHVMSALSYNTDLLLALYKCITTTQSFEDTLIFQKTSSNINSLFEDAVWYKEHLNEIQNNLEQLNSKCIPAKQPISIPIPPKKYTFPSKIEKKEFWNRVEKLKQKKIEEMKYAKDTDYVFIKACKISQDQLNSLRSPDALEIEYSVIYKIAEYLKCVPDYLLVKSNIPTEQEDGKKRAITFAPIANARSFISQYLSQRNAKETLDLLIILLIALPKSDSENLKQKLRESLSETEYNNTK